MRIPVPGALVASTASSAAGYDAASHQQQHLLRPARQRRSLSRALDETDLSGLFREEANSWNFVAMGSRAKTDNEPEQALVENIARAMENRPLMRRLASIEAEFGDAPLPGPFHTLTPPQLGPALAAPSLSAPMDSFTAIAAGIGIAPLTSGVRDLDLIKRRVEEAEAGWTLPPRSSEWLGMARREHRRTLLRNAAAWLATLFIGGSIIVATALMLQH
jgi:hypothetical protein